MRKALGEVTELALLLGIVLLSEQAQVVAQSEQPFDEFLRLTRAGEGVVVRQPKAARPESAVGAGLEYNGSGDRCTRVGLTSRHEGQPSSRYARCGLVERND